ncbi:hypothetical protein [Flagellimonas sp. 2504JD4-2]
MRIIRFIVLTFLFSYPAHAQWNTTSVSNEVSTTDEIVGPVLRLSNEIRIPNTFTPTDPTIGTLDNSHYGINLHKINGIGFAFNGIHQMVFKPNGDTGIGTSSPTGRLHVSTGTSGDAIFRLEADSDNNNESDNPLIQLRQDGGQVGINMGFSEGSFGSNIFGIGTRRTDIDKWDVFTINTANGYVGIGTNTSQSKLHISTGTSGDAILRLEADTDNNNEADNPGIHFVQDGELVDYFVEIEGNANTKSTGTVANALIIGTEANRDIQFINGDQVQVTVKTSGVGIGTTSPDSKLTVKGNIHAEEVKVDLSVPGPDYVFKEEYDLKSLEEVQNYIKEHGHLPNIPSAKEMEANGVQLGEMNMKLLEKIEELVLYTLEQEEKLKEINELKAKVSEQENRLAKLEQLLNR